MPLVAAERNAVADFEAGRLSFVSLHTADPGTTGASEASGGSYVRKALAFAAASGGTATATEVSFDLPAGSYTHFGAWSAATGGTFRGGNPLSPSVTIGSAGQVRVTISLPVTAG